MLTILDITHISYYSLFMVEKRYLFSHIQKDLKSKMVFIGGARQVGKTTLALKYLKPSDPKHPAYLNWDISSHQENIIKNQIPLKFKTIVFDEIHKYVKWRNFMKGLYDEHHRTHSFLVTGSARLDFFSKGGDSLLGRYHYYRLHPFSLFEINKNPTRKDLEQLLTFGGFPEPFSKQSKTFSKRWFRERRKRVIQEDIRDLQKIKEISYIDLLIEALPSRVASPLSIRSIKEDLQVSHQSIENWIQILENLYMIFRIPPYGSPQIRAVKKEQKLYFFDWSHILDENIKFENLVASHLLKYCHYHEDINGDDMELRFLRDTDKREVDFVVLKNKKPLFAVECKAGERALSPHLKYFKERTPIPLWFQVHRGKKDYGDEKTTGRVLPFTTFSKDHLKL
ncbi:MAG: ATP-binding protein [Bdellovibrionales bacterium]|nr:ATP-binding protein [Bdellovibrionales bacterium]